MNGHAIIVRNQKSEVDPPLIFDIKEVVILPAMKGLPATSLNPKIPLFGIISRYHKNLVTGDTSGTVFFFECSTEKEKKEWLLAYHVNIQWAKRYSALFYPRGSAEIAYSEPSYDISIGASNDTYIRSHRFNSAPLVEGEIEKQVKKTLFSLF